MNLIRRYPLDVRSQAIIAVEQRRLVNPRDRTIFREVAVQFGVGEQSLRLWVKKHDADRLATSTKTADAGPKELEEDAAPNESGLPIVQMETELANLRKEIQKLRIENEVLKRAFVVFSAEWSKPE